MNKQIKFSTAIDTTNFDKSIEQMQRKLAQIYQKSDASRSAFETKASTGAVGLGPRSTMQDSARQDQMDRQSRRELDMFIKSQIKHQENLNQGLKKQLEMQKEIHKLSKEQQNELNQKINQTRSSLSASQGAVAEALKARQLPGYDGVGGFGGAAQRGLANYRIAGGGIGGIGSGMAGFGQGIASYFKANPLAVAGSLLGALGAGASLYSNVGTAFNQAPRQILAAQGAASGIYGQTIRDVFGRNAMSQAFFSQQSAKSLNSANREIDRQKTLDNVGLFGEAVTKIGGYGLAGASIGAGSLGLAGSPAGPLGMAVGGTIGGIGGGIAGLGYGAYKFVTGDNFKSRITGTYGSQMEQRRAQAFAQNLESEKNLDPVRTAAFERYMQESQANLPLQRSLGLGDDAMNDELLRGTRRGFTTDQTRSMMGRISSSGGSTEAASMYSSFANQAERSMGLTNAGEVMGRLSSLTGSGSGASASFTKIMAEAVSLGLDDSKVGERLSFVSTAVDLISRTGAQGVDNQSALTQRLSSFAGDGSMASIKSAANISELFSQTTATTGGARGAIQAAAINRDPTLRNLSVDQKNALLSMSEEQILSGDPIIEGIMEETGKSADDLINTIKRPAFITRKDIDSKISKYKQTSDPTARKKLGSSILSGASYDNPGILNMSPSDKNSLLRAMTGDPGATNQDRSLLESTVSGRLAEGPQYAGDKINAANAGGDQAFLGAISAFKPQIDQATAASAKFAEEAVKAAKMLTDAFKEADPEKIKTSLAVLSGAFNTAATPNGRQMVQPKVGPSGK